MNRAPHRPDHELDASLRVLSHYDPATDSIETRIDVLLGPDKNPANQYPFAFTSSKPGTSPLHVPDGRGVIEGFDVRVSRGDLIVALRGLADAIENHKPEPSISLRKLTEYVPCSLDTKSGKNADHMWQALVAASGG